jgi:hypothetical protein
MTAITVGRMCSTESAASKPIQNTPGDLVLIDEVSMVATPGYQNAELGYVFTTSPKRAGPAPGAPPPPAPAPELARYDQIHAERADVPAPATPPAPPGEALAVLSAVGERDGQLQSASATGPVQPSRSPQARGPRRSPPSPTPGEQIPKTGRRIKDLAACGRSWPRRS